MKDTGQYYCSQLKKEELHVKHGWYGEKVTPPSLKKYTVFVQSKGSGTRHVPGGNMLLYEVCATTVYYHIEWFTVLPGKRAKLFKSLFCTK